MQIFEKYEIYDSETDEIYITGYSDLLAYKSLYKEQEQHYFARLRMVYKEI